MLVEGVFRTHCFTPAVFSRGLLLLLPRQMLCCHGHHAVLLSWIASAACSAPFQDRCYGRADLLRWMGFDDAADILCSAAK